jgi:hypothetical protein
MNKLKILALTLIILGSVSAAEFHLSAQALLGYCALPDELSGTQRYSYYYWQKYAAEDGTGDQLLTTNDNRIKINLKNTGKSTIGWSYTFGLFFDKIGLNFNLEHGSSLVEDYKMSSYSIRDSLNYGSIPNDYFVESGNKYETTSISFMRAGLSIRYRHAISNRLNLQFGIGPCITDTWINYNIRTENCKRSYYQNNGNLIMDESLADDFNQISLHISAVETVPDAAVTWKLSRALDLNFGVKLPFSPVKNIGIGENSYGDEDIVLDRQFWLTNAEIKAGITFIAGRKE